MKLESLLSVVSGLSVSPNHWLNLGLGTGGIHSRKIARKLDGKQHYDDLLILDGHKSGLLVNSILFAGIYTHLVAPKKIMTHNWLVLFTFLIFWPLGLKISVFSLWHWL